MIKSLIILVMLVHAGNTYASCDELGKNRFIDRCRIGEQCDFKPVALTGKRGSPEYDYNLALNDYIKQYQGGARSSRKLRYYRACVRLGRDSKCHDAVGGFREFNKSIENEFLALARRQYLPALYCLGYIYEEGIGVDIDLPKAWAFFYTIYATDWVSMREHQARLLGKLVGEDEIRGKGLAHDYIRLYTGIMEKQPSRTIIR